MAQKLDSKTQMAVLVFFETSAMDLTGGWLEVCNYPRFHGRYIYVHVPWIRHGYLVVGFNPFEKY